MLDNYINEIWNVLNEIEDQTGLNAAEVLGANTPTELEQIILEFAEAMDNSGLSFIELLEYNNIINAE